MIICLKISQLIPKLWVLLYKNNMINIKIIIKILTFYKPKEVLFAQR